MTLLNHESETSSVGAAARDRRKDLCVVLIERLRRETGANWQLLPSLSDDPYPVHPNTSIEARTDDASTPTLIQPVNAILEWKVWHTLAQERTIRKYFWVEGAADSVRSQVMNTLHGLPESIPARMILAFDSGPLDDRALSHVMKSFKKQHGSWARQVGFRALWLVGSTPDSCWRLDGD